MPQYLKTRLPKRLPDSPATARMWLKEEVSDPLLKVTLKSPSGNRILKVRDTFAYLSNTEDGVYHNFRVWQPFQMTNLLTIIESNREVEAEWLPIITRMAESYAQEELREFFFAHYKERGIRYWKFTHDSLQEALLLPSEVKAVQAADPKTPVICPVTGYNLSQLLQDNPSE